MIRFGLLSVILFVSLFAHPVDLKENARLIVSTDIGGADPDDMQSMLHMLLCSDRIDIEGLISAPAWVPHPDHTDKIRAAVSRYADILPNLKVHSSGYPSSEHFDSIIVRGQTTPHMSGVGEGKDSPGSELIIRSVDNEDDPRPVWIAAWGGINTAAQAIWKVKNTRSESEFRKFISKIRIYDILGQDDAGAWIARNFPEITYIRNAHVYGWAPDDVWTKEHIQSKGVYGAFYPDRIWATEGDSPSFLYLIANGLNDPEHPEYGGWGGRFSLDKAKNIRGMDFIAKSGKDESIYDDYFMLASAEEGVNAINLWKNHIHNDFAARMIWGMESDFSKANHHPVAIVNGKKGILPLIIKGKSGKVITLKAGESTDPDNDRLRYRWMYYKEPGSYEGSFEIRGEDSAECSFTIPRDASGKTLQIILEVTDSGVPALTSYRRIIVNVK